MPFNVPNDPTAPVTPATYAVQAQLDKGDIDTVIGGFYGTGVVSGLAVTPHSSGVSLNVDVAAGVAVIQSKQVSVSATSNLAVAAADPTNTRIDLVIFTTAFGVSILQGTASSTPDYPTLSFDSNGNLTQAVLAAVTIPGGASSITANNIVDKRVWRRIAGPASRLFLRRYCR